MSGNVHLRREGPVAHVTFDRPEARNAMTWAMYEQLASICGRIGADSAIRVATFRGTGGSFVAGTDIQQFTEFRTGDDGVEYERRMERFLTSLDRLPCPTLAVVDGWCVGGGLAIAACCDLRIATPAASFGVPIARTLGNCLSMSSYARLVAEFGIGRVKRMILGGTLLSAAEAREAGFVTEIVEAGSIDDRTAEWVVRLTRNAPITMRVSKEAIRRVIASGVLEGDDLIRDCYGSADFHEGVSAFLAKRKPAWSGR
ncbi:enoyl-CoA hydratase/isomerase family protein [Microvirga lotononidis]|uniref:Enoyl-CoA hydratase/carnithine racemase n=1 Tax=Microvirga lotononidis TaxID=864069 RepID=I4YQD5_9HYPH|nr:enoyl-CoA hydratase/isomerase family protein [Microvirga lotononidis]EIM26177.1 enoyl-CoA hydratase/carnithine racemase [Microvirga lotononidis]WQO31485.1 enoyl-CoA hydratase/isomerase family protein [Microvirga lotononidis]